jgi:hypothetical protein
MNSPDAAPGPRFFSIQNGLVISETGQQDADDFAADFQGLRHFADRIGAGLDLGGSLYASLHEPDFTFMYMLQSDGGQPGNASGVMIDGSVSNNEMMVVLRQRNG